MIKTEDCGVKKLWSAVMLQAIKDIVQKPHPRANPSKLMEIELYRDQAWRWVKSPQKRFGSFYWVCDVIDADPLAVRRDIRRLKKQGYKEKAIWLKV